MIKLEKLSKVFSDNKVINNVTTEFETGKVTSIIGPNGAGKSTLLSMASRLVNKDNGFVYINGKEIADWDNKELAKKLAVLRQSNNVSMRFTVRTIQHKYLDELSGGQRQLAYIAMVIAQDTDSIFLDEPLNNLDIKHSLQIMRNIQKLAHEMNKAVVVVIHDINFAACYSDVIIALKKGEVVASGKVEEVIQADVLESIYETPFNIVEVDGKRMCSYY